jgi:hypothetical protein
MAGQPFLPGIWSKRETGQTAQSSFHWPAGIMSETIANITPRSGMSFFDKAVWYVLLGLSMWPFNCSGD